MSVSQDVHAKKPPAKRRARNVIPEQVDVAIVGCGLGGLTAAGYLAKQGFKVACFDPHYVAGGCATTFARGSGANRYHFDIGLHYIGDCGPTGMIPTLLNGLEIEQQFVPMDQDGFDTLVFPDFRFRIPADVDLYRQRLLDLFPEERRGIDRYVKFLNQIDKISSRIDQNKGRMSPAILLQTVFKGYYLARYQNSTIEDFFEGCTKNEKLRAIWLGQSGDYGLPPSEVSAILHGGLAVHYFRGAYYPKGGGQIISDKIAAAVEGYGGSVHLKCGIDEILVEDGRAVGVRTESRRGDVFEVRADAVLSGADIKKTLLELVPRDALPGAWVQRANDFQMGGAIFMTFLGIDRDMRKAGMRATNYWQFDGYDMEAFYKANRGVEEPTPMGCYITSASMKDPDTRGHHAPEGIESVEVMTIVPGEARLWGVDDESAIHKWTYKHDEGYKSLKQRIEDNMVERLEGLFPGSAEKIVYRESATPVTHSRYTRASDGTGYGLACTPDQFMKKRPGYRGPIDGLYFAGASTRAGHGIVGAMLGGYYSALRVSADLGRPIAPR